MDFKIGDIPEGYSWFNLEKKESMESREALPKEVYYIESSSDDTVLVGVNAEVIVEERNDDEDIRYVRWFDLNKNRMMRVAEMDKNGDYFGFIRADDNGEATGQEYYFIPMSLEVYREKVMPKIPDAGDYVSDEEMLKAFLDEVGYSNDK